MIDGAEIFKLMDTHGLPLEIITELLREKGEAFDVVQFIEAGLFSHNFTYPKLRTRLIEAIDPQGKDSFIDTLDKVAKIKGWE
ncbi:MAG: hypothetical protein MUP81_02280 [Dehalococcoidia bacterium]|nr:hypothetical protein [Dehalococcoidia bacterium]